jgi:carboxymethylenebutenolidase
VTGPASADKAIFAIYDIFGFYPQTIQGADILAFSEAQHPYQVFMPDFFDGNPAQISWYPPDDDDKKEKLDQWWTSAAPSQHLPKIERLLDAAETFNRNIKTWGVIGYCWGGKMASILAGTDARFEAAVQTSPARIDPSEAEEAKIPMMILASEEESEDQVKQYSTRLNVKKQVEHFGDQAHGFMSARADLENPQARSAYHEGYRLALDFFKENLT